MTGADPAPARLPEVVIRRAEAGEARACRMLMPETFTADFAPELWVAIDGSTSRIAGAAAVAWRPFLEPPGFPVQVHVVPPWRRRVSATALLGAASRAAIGSTSRLHGWSSVPEDSPAASFLMATGFGVRRRLLGFEADGPRFYAMIKAIHDRLTSAGKIPPGFKVVELREAATEAVASLVAETFRDTPGVILAGIERGLVGYDAEHSVVLLDNGEVRGALLYKWNGGTPQIDINVVAPELRRSAANVLLLEAATRNGLDGGARSFRFSCEESVRDTMNLVRRAGATPTGATIAFTRPLPNA
jgi:hypothetical protein